MSKDTQRSLRSSWGGSADPNAMTRQEEVFGETIVLTRSEKRRRDAQKEALVTRGAVGA